MWFLKVVLWVGAIVLLFVGIFGGVLDIVSVTGVSIPPGVALAVAAGLVALEREVKVLSLNWRLNSKRDLQRRIDKLAEFRRDAITTLYAGTPSAEDFPEWVSRFQSWEKSLVSYLKEEFPYAVFEMFEDLGVIPATNFQHLSAHPGIKNKHLHYLRMLAKHLVALERLIVENTSLTRDREPGLSELLESGPTG